MKIEIVKDNQFGGYIINGSVNVPAAPGNSDRQRVQEWIEAGGVVEPADIYEPTYKENREQEYPKIGDQMDVLWKQFNYLRLNGVDLIQEGDDMLGAILAVKAAHPKV